MTEKPKTRFAQACGFLSGVEPGQTVEIPIVSRVPARRIAQQTVNAAAYKMWGAGMYSMRSENDPPRLVVTRRAERKTFASPRKYNQVADEWGVLCQNYRTFLEGDPT